MRRRFFSVAERPTAPVARSQERPGIRLGGGGLLPYLPEVNVATPFRSIQHVYFDDLDALNILHNVRFVLFTERARGELFNALGFRWEDDIAHNPDKFHVVAEHHIRYLVPVRGEGDLEVFLQPVHLGTSSLRIAARVCAVGGAVCHAEGTTRLVRLDPATSRPCPWSARFRATMGPLVVPAAG